MLTNITPTTFKARIVLVSPKNPNVKMDFMPFASTACFPTMLPSNILFAIFSRLLKKIPPIIKKPS